MPRLAALLAVVFLLLPASSATAGAGSGGSSASFAKPTVERWTPPSARERPVAPRSEGALEEENPYRFQGRRFDGESGLYHYRLRYLDPAQGRFVSRDPLGLWGDPDQLGNDYSFAGNDPVNGVDPFGDDLIDLFHEHVLQPLGLGAPSTQKYKGWMQRPMGSGTRLVSAPKGGERVEIKESTAGKLLTDEAQTLVKTGKAAAAEWKYGSKVMAGVYGAALLLLAVDAALTGVSGGTTKGVKLGLRGMAEGTGEILESASRLKEIRLLLQKVLKHRFDPDDKKGTCLNAAFEAAMMLAKRAGGAVRSKRVREVFERLEEGKSLKNTDARDLLVAAEMISPAAGKQAIKKAFFGTTEELTKRLKKAEDGVYLVTGAGPSYGHVFNAVVKKGSVEVIDVTRKATKARGPAPGKDVEWTLFRIGASKF